MTSADEANKRRSSRVFIRIRVMAKGKNLDGRAFRQPTETIVINAHGGLLYLNETLEMGSDVTIINPETEDEQECRVVYLGGSADRGQRVGLEFLTPAPHFWGVEFPPPDWPGRGSESSQAQAS
jgi:hypothetical protein